MPLCQYIYTCVHMCIPMCSWAEHGSSAYRQQHNTLFWGHLDLLDHAYSSGTLRCRLGLLLRACIGNTMPDVKEVQNHTGKGQPEIILCTNTHGTGPVPPPSQSWCPTSQATPPCPLHQMVHDPRQATYSCAQGQALVCPVSRKTLPMQRVLGGNAIPL